MHDMGTKYKTELIKQKLNSLNKLATIRMCKILKTTQNRPKSRGVLNMSTLTLSTWIKAIPYFRL